ncbi:hypothetical protein SDC9_146816 [bioreactor metagenome]|uniref:Uncharacterized protein n=1 Tax=bioreactor metagenome TaxID=1076179 RepID=A0A645EC59_9ZZZZ
MIDYDRAGAVGREVGFQRLVDHGEHVLCDGQNRGEGKQRCAFDLDCADGERRNPAKPEQAAVVEPNLQRFIRPFFSAVKTANIGAVEGTLHLDAGDRTARFHKVGVVPRVRRFGVAGQIHAKRPHVFDFQCVQQRGNTGERLCWSHIQFGYLRLVGYVVKLIQRDGDTAAFEKVHARFVA